MDLSGSSLTILTEGDARRGLGHVTRCLAHAEVWQAAGARVHWRLDGDDGLARQMIQASLPEHLDQIVPGAWQDAPEPLAGMPADVVLVDSYRLTPALAALICRQARRAVFIDDRQAMAYPGGLVLHPAPDPAPRQRDEAQWLTGPMWQALRQPFLEAVEPPARQPEIRRVLVMMGGSDAAGMGPSIASSITRLLPRAGVRLVGHAQPEGAVAWAGLGPLSPEVLVEEMRAADLAISAGGQSLFELAAQGTPTVMVGVAENQRPNLEYWPARTGFRNAGMADDPDFEVRLSRCIAALAPVEARNNVAKRAWSLVDGLGAIRLVHALGMGA